MTVEYGDFSFPAAGCGHTIYAWVDPLDRIAEVDEVNNLARRDICVEDGSLGGETEYYLPIVRR